MLLPSMHAPSTRANTSRNSRVMTWHSAKIAKERFAEVHRPAAITSPHR